MEVLPEPLHPFVAEIVRTLRQAKGWKQEDLALKLRVQPSEISLLESGKRNSQLYTLQRLAWALDVKCYQLIWLAETLQHRVERDRRAD